VRRSKSGNPAKRAAEDRAAVERAATAPRAGTAFGLGATKPEEFDPTTLSLPGGFDKYLGR
jgi:signal recognition particle subunit SRP54